MGEIKSTLDLVMEKTRHLSLSDEEKARHRQLEFDKRVQGLLLQFEKGALGVDEFTERIAALQSEMQLPRRRTLLRSICQRLDPDGDSGRWLELMERLAPAVREPLQKSLSEYSQRRADLVLKSERLERARLADDHDVRGTAVKPNPEKDAGFAQSLFALRNRTRERMDAVLQQVEDRG